MKRFVTAMADGDQYRHIYDLKYGYPVRVCTAFCSSPLLHEPEHLVKMPDVKPDCKSCLKVNIPNYITKRG